MASKTLPESSASSQLLGGGTQFTATPPRLGPDIAITIGVSPWVYVYPWAGLFGTKISDPVNAPTLACADVAFSPDGKILAVAQQSSIGYHWAWNGSFSSTLTSIGFGLGGTTPVHIAISPNNDVLAHSSYDSGTTTYLAGNQTISTSTGTVGTAYNDGGTLYYGSDVCWQTPQTGYFFVGIRSATGSSYLYSYQQKATAATPAAPASFDSIIASTTNHAVQVDYISSTSTTGYAVATTAVSPYILAVPWSSATATFGTIISGPATAAVGGTSASGANDQDIAASPLGNAVVRSSATTPYVSAHAWSNSTYWGSRFSDPATLPSGAVTGVAFSPAGDTVALASTSSPYINAYAFSGTSGWGTKASNPATLPSSVGTGNTSPRVAFSARYIP